MRIQFLFSLYFVVVAFFLDRAMWRGKKASKDKRHRAQPLTCWKRQHYQEYSLRFDYLSCIIISDMRTVSAPLHIDLYIHIHIIDCKCYFQMTCACRERAHVAFYLASTFGFEKCSLIPVGHKVPSELQSRKRVRQVARASNVKAKTRQKNDSNKWSREESFALIFFTKDALHLGKW